MKDSRRDLTRAEGQNQLPQPASHAAFDAAQDTVGLLGCERTLLAHVKLFIHQYPQVLLDRATLNTFISQSVLLQEVSPTQMRTLYLGLLKLMRFTQAHFLSFSRSLWMASHPSGLSTAPLSLVKMLIKSQLFVLYSLICHRFYVFHKFCLMMRQNHYFTSMN